MNWKLTFSIWVSSLTFLFWFQVADSINQGVTGIILGSIFVMLSCLLTGYFLIQLALDDKKKERGA